MFDPQLTGGGGLAPAFFRWLLLPFRSRGFLCLSLWLLLAGVCLRLFLMYQAVPLWTVSDSRDYHDFARSLMEGRGFCQVYRNGEHEAFNGMTFYAYRLPGYPLLLAIVYKLFGWHALVGMHLNLAVDILSAFFLAVIAYHLYGRAAAGWAQALWVLHAFWTPSLLSESVFTAALLGVVLLLVYGLPMRSGAGALVYGCAVCAVSFIRPHGVSIYLATGFKMLRTPMAFRRKVLLLALALLPLVVGVSLWAYRNYRLLGHPVLFATMQGRVNAKDFGISFERAYWECRQKGLNEAEINGVIKKAIREKTRRNPGYALRLYRDRALQLFRLRPRRDWGFMHFDFQYGRRIQPPWLMGIVQWLYAQYYVVYGLAACGLILMPRRRAPWFDLLTVILGYTVMQALAARPSIRYAAPLFPLLILFAAYALSRLTAEWPRRRAAVPPAAP